MSWTEQRVQVLLGGASSAIRRARYVFAALNIAGVILLAAQFNASFPWIRHAQKRAEHSVDGDRLEKMKEEQDRQSQSAATGSSTQTPLVGLTEKEMAERIAREHRRRATEVMEERLTDIRQRDLGLVSVPVVGVQFSVHDLSVVGSAAMAILAVWFFYSVRRENHAVAAVIKAANRVLPAERELAACLYHGIAHQFVFTTSVEQDTPEGEAPRVGPRLALKILFYMPVWVLFLLVASDVYSLFCHSQVGDKTVPLYSALVSAEWFDIALRELFAVAMALFAWSQCAECVRFDTAIRKNLTDLKRNLISLDEKEPPNLQYLK